MDFANWKSKRHSEQVSEWNRWWNKTWNNADKLSFSLSFCVSRADPLCQSLVVFTSFYRSQVPHGQWKKNTHSHRRNSERNCRYQRRLKLKRIQFSFCRFDADAVSYSFAFKPFEHVSRCRTNRFFSLSCPLFLSFFFIDSFRRRTLNCHFFSSLFYTLTLSHLHWTVPIVGKWCGRAEK